MFRFTVFFVLILLMSFVGCNDTADPPAPENNPDSAYLLGLTRDHQMRYGIYDSIVIISLDEPDTVIYDTSSLDIAITRGLNNQVELSVDGFPHDLLTLDDLGVLHSGQIRPLAQPPDTVFFYPTPIIMPRSIFLGSTWYIDSPPFAAEMGEIKRTLLYFNYGYFTERQYQGRESVVLPSGSYDARHFRSLLFSDINSTDTLFYVDEYYAGGIGPVKIVARYDRSQRLIILLEDQ